jgi:phenylpropionate dioxygenase-like ring-hydroxylating dioxygenase large terminal subunit
MSRISAHVFDRVVDHITHGTTDMADSALHVPVRHFVSPEHLADEIAVIRRQWLIGAMTCELPEPGSFVTRDIMGTSLLFVRRKSGNVATYLNMCRHRGGKVEQDERGKKPFFVCGYHGWSYDGEGALRGVPYEEQLGPVDRACNSLHAVACEERHGIVWIDLSGTRTDSVAAFLGAADPVLADHALDRCVIHMEKRIHVPINWKLVMDGAIDVLHPQFLHPNGVGKLVQTNATVWQDLGRHGRSFSVYKKFADKVRAGQVDPADQRHITGNMVLFPNVNLIPTPDHFEFWNVWPDPADPGTCFVHIRFVIEAAKLDDRMAGRMQRSWEILEQAALEEDFPMEETIQANARSHPAGDFLYGRSEQPCQHLHRQMAREMAEISA